MKQDITCVFQGVSGVGGIYISNLKAAQNLNLLHSLQIKAIVTVVRNAKVSHNKSDINDHLYVPADDVETYDISQHFEETYNFIDKVRKKSNILVHCYAGISRSATIVIAYLLKKYNYSLDKVICMVKRKRNKINPNKGFIEQLKKQAAKMGIFTQEKEFTKVLSKHSLSVQMNRSKIYCSTGKQTKQKSIIQIKKSIHLKTQQNQKSSPIKSRLNQQQKEENINRDIYQTKNTTKSPNNNNYFTIEVENKTTKILKQNLDLTKYMKYINLLSDSNHQKISISTSNPIPISNKQSNVLLPQKLTRIEKLKSKIIDSQKRKKSKAEITQQQIHDDDFNSPSKQASIQGKTIQNSSLVASMLRKLTNQGKGSISGSIMNLHKNICIKGPYDDKRI